ncbi:MAG: ATP-binding protein [Minicystis sp.]
MRINERLAEINGVPAADHLGKTVREVLPGLADAVEPLFQRVLATGEPLVEMEIEGETPARPGVRRTWRESFFPLHDDGGALLGINIVCEEITERKLLLESERAARAEAERANRMKDEFLAVVSHELRTPLNAMLGWSSLLRRPGATREQIDKGLGVIERNTRIQVQLISDLLDVSRIISGKLHVDLQPVALSTVIEGAVEAVRGVAALKGVAIDEAIAPLDAPLWVDPARIQQIATNLLSNAIKFTPPGGRVEVSLGRRGDQAELVVRDTGQGILPEFLPHVFDRFRQADASTTRQHGGLGLGLAIVKHLVDLHGGAVRAESEGAGRGASFTVSLPCEAAPVEDSPLPALVEAPSLRGVRVLVVDDEEDTRVLVARVLEEHDAAVAAAASAGEALDLLRGRAFDVVLSDIGMPGMDGYALVQAIRGGAAGARDVPAIAMTAFVRAEDRERALSAGYQVHLGKPFEPAALVAAVASLASAPAPLAGQAHGREAEHRGQHRRGEAEIATA